MSTPLNLPKEAQITEITSPVPTVVDVSELHTPGDPGSRALITFEDGTEVAVHDAACTGGDPALLKSLLDYVLNSGIPESISTPKEVTQLSPSWEINTPFGWVRIDSYGRMTLGAVDMVDQPYNMFHLNAELPAERYTIYREYGHVVKMLEAMRERYVPEPGIWLARLSDNKPWAEFGGAMPVQQATFNLHDFQYSRKVCFSTSKNPCLRDGANPGYYVPYAAKILTTDLGLYAILTGELSWDASFARWGSFLKALEGESQFLAWASRDTYMSRVKDLYARIFLQG